MLKCYTMVKYGKHVKTVTCIKNSLLNGRTSSARFGILSCWAVIVVLSGGWTFTQLSYFQNDGVPARGRSQIGRRRYSNASPHFQLSDTLNTSNHFTKFVKDSSAQALAAAPRTSAIIHPEVRHIGFVKVHKAASSTMQNIFFRFGMKRNLTFVFTRHPNYFSRAPNFHIPLVRPKLRKGYDILCNHGIFNYRIYSSLLPNDTVYLGIVRDPIAVFISAVNYYSQPSQRIEYIARVPGNKIKNLIHKPERYDRHFFSYTKNVMARDFGFPETDDSRRIDRKLKELDTVFRLVLIVEHFEESLILMKRYLFWDLKDILFLSNNVYGKGASVSDLSKDDVERFRLRNALDYRLYNYFYQRFWKQYKAETSDIEDEVKHLKHVLERLKVFCGRSEESNDTFIVQETRWNKEFSLDVTDCDYMEKDELVFIQILRKKQGSQLK